MQLCCQSLVIKQFLLFISSKIVFLLPSKYNQKYTNDEIIIFDDYFHEKIGSIKTKSDNISKLFIKCLYHYILLMQQL